MTLDEWFQREHPSGVVDWYKEYERLLSALEQAMPSICAGETNAATKLLQTALDTGNFLLIKEEHERSTKEIVAHSDAGLRNETASQPA